MTTLRDDQGRHNLCPLDSTKNIELAEVFFLPANNVWLYSRAHCALQGCRPVQVASSRNLTSFDEFELCRFSNATLEDNIYFAHMYVIDRVLFAVVPAALAQGNGIHLYTSEDGIFFVHQKKLKPCMVHNSRTYDVPIAGASFSQSFLRLGIVENATKRVPPHIQETDIFSWRTFDLRSLFTTLGISCP